MPFAGPELTGGYFTRFLTTNGDGTGTVNANLDFSGAPVDFFIQPAVNETLIINQATVHIADTGPVDAGFYGNGIVLANGIEILLTQGPIVLLDITASFKIFTNGDWAQYAFEANTTDFGAGINYVHVLFTFAGITAKPRIFQNQQLRIRLNDDFTGLVTHSFLVQGAVAS